MSRYLLLAAILSVAGAANATRAEQPISGFEFLSPETKALQRDDFANPGMFWAEIGKSLWKQQPAIGKSCSECHGAAESSMRSVGTRYPAWSENARKVINLEQQINICRTQRQHEPALAPQSQPLIALSTLIMLQSRGLPMNVPTDGPAAQSYARGRAYFETRRGQLNLSCANCHSERTGQRLRGEVISQGQVNGFPIYRQLWQDIGSVGRMIAWCNDAVRAEPQAFDSQVYVDLELYLRARGKGLALEAPAIRR